jgi:hypothetical protein
MANVTAGTRTARTTPLGDSARTEAFETVDTYIRLFGAVSALVLATVAVTAPAGHTATPFMWVRGAILLAAAPLLRRMAARASQGSARDFDRLRTLTAVSPITLIGVDLIPGLCPAWYAVLQGLSALALVGIAVLTRSAALRAAFPRQK